MVIQPTPNLTQPLPDFIQHKSICMGLPKLTVNMYNYRMHVAAHTVKVGYIHVNTTHNKQQQQQHSLFPQASWCRLEMKSERNKFKVQAH